MSIIRTVPIETDNAAARPYASPISTSANAFVWPCICARLPMRTIQVADEGRKKSWKDR